MDNIDFSHHYFVAMLQVRIEEIDHMFAEMWMECFYEEENLWRMFI